MARVTVQMGHVGTDSNLEEQEFVKRLAPFIEARLRALGHAVIVVDALGGPDGRGQAPPGDVFIALHTDASKDPRLRGASAGYLDCRNPSTPLDVDSQQLARGWRAAHLGRGWPGGFQDDNYTGPNMACYYMWFRTPGYRWKYLAEHGFLTNEQDKDWLYAHLGECAQAHVDAIGVIVGHPVPPLPGWPTSIKLALRAASGHYAGVTGGGGSSVIADRRKIDPATDVFEVVVMTERTVALRTADGRHFLRADRAANIVDATSDEVGLLETFEIERAREGVMLFLPAIGTAPRPAVVAVGGGGGRLGVDPHLLQTPWSVFAPVGGGAVMRQANGPSVRVAGSRIRVDGPWPIPVFEVIYRGMSASGSGGSGDVSLRTVDKGLVVGAVGDASNVVVAEYSPGLGLYQRFTLIARPGGAFALRTEDNSKYLTVQADGLVSSAGTGIGSAQTFSFVAVDTEPSWAATWSPPARMTMALQAQNGQYVAARPDVTAATVVVEGTEVGDDEVFEIVPQPNGRVALLAPNKRYVRHTQSGLLADQARVGFWEEYNAPPPTIFEITRAGSGILPRCANDTFVVAEGGGGGRIRLAPGSAWSVFGVMGATVTLQTSDGLPLRVVNHTLVAGGTNSPTVFELVYRGLREVSLRTEDTGAVLWSDRGADRTVRAWYTEGFTTEEQRFQIVAQSDGNVALRGEYGLYLSSDAHASVTAPVTASEFRVGPAETFRMNVVKRRPQGPVWAPPVSLTIALCAPSGHYVVAETDRSGTVLANRARIGEWEVFELEPQVSGGVALRTAHARYVRQANPTGEGGLVSDRAEVGAWTDYDTPPATMLRIDRAGAGIVLRTVDDAFVEPVGGGGGGLVLKHGDLSAWGVFTAVGAGVTLHALKDQPLCVVGDTVRADPEAEAAIFELIPRGAGEVSLRTIDRGARMFAVDGGGGGVKATYAGSYDSDHRFRLVAQPDGTVALRSASGHYLTVAPADGPSAPVLATSVRIGAAETFTMTVVEPVPRGRLWAPPVPITCALRSSGGYYLSAPPLGPPTADRSTIGEYELFELIRQVSGSFGDPAIAVRARRGGQDKYLVADPEGGLGLRDDIGPWPSAAAPPLTIFALQSQHDGLTLRARSGKFAVAEAGGLGEVRSDGAPGSPWTVFNPLGAIVQLVAHNDEFLSVADGVVNAFKDGVVATRFELLPRGAGRVAVRVLDTDDFIDPAAAGSFVYAEGGGGGALLASRSADRDWATFELVAQPWGRVALRAPDGRYVTVLNDGSVAATSVRIEAGEGDRGPETFDVSPRGLPDFAHRVTKVFVLMLENRSFDHMLGFSGIRGFDSVSGVARDIDGIDPTHPPSNTDLDDPTHPRFVASAGAERTLLPDDGDPPHEFNDVLKQLSERAPYPCVDPNHSYPPITNGGFYWSYKLTGSARPGQAMKGYSPGQLPVLNALAREFAVCDRWFSSMPGPTWPNRFFVHAATSGGLDDSLSGGDTFNAFTLAPISFEHGTIFDRLSDDKAIPWRIYSGDWLPPQAYSMSTFHTLEHTIDPKIVDFERFRDEVSDPSYSPAYTFIEPSYGHSVNVYVRDDDYRCGNSQHPLDDVARGDELIKDVYEAIRHSPHWDTSVLIVTWDEHGGFYDHVTPPPATPPGDADGKFPGKFRFHGFDFSQLGVRVPALVISPLVPANRVDHQQYDHSSVLATLEALMSLKPLTNRDAEANDVLHMLSLPVPRTDAPWFLPVPEPPMLDCNWSFWDHLPDPGDVLRLPTSFWGWLHVLGRRLISLYDEGEKRDVIIKEFEAIASNYDAVVFARKAVLAIRAEAGDHPV